VARSRFPVFAVLCATLAVPPHLACAQNIPRTSGGHPDLQGVWNYGTMTPLQRPERWAGIEVLPEEEAVAWERETWARRAEVNQTAGTDWWEPTELRNRRTALIVDPPDGRIPPMTPEAEARRRASRRSNEGRYDNPETFNLRDQCVAWETSGPPMMPTVYNNNVLIVETPDFVVLETEMIHNARIVPMDGRPHGSMASIQGDPVGHWEGDTLVVETVNFDGRLGFQGSGTNLRLVERFVPTSDHTLAYRFTVEDPDTWTRPWTAQVDMEKSDDQIFEFACHEGNQRSVEGILRGARYEEALH
jgi:hypothetical protein